MIRTGARPLLTRPMVLLGVTSLASMTTFYLLVPLVPLYTAEGGSGDMGAGLSTGVTMLATVLMELVTPALLGRYGYRAGMALGVLLLGAPSALLVLSSGLPMVLTTSLARGAGLAIVVVAGPALVAELAPAGRRGEALGVYGVAVGIPAILGLPIGLWLVPLLGYGPVFLAATGLTLLALIGIPWLPARTAPVEQHGGVLHALRRAGIARPVIVFAVIALAAGVLLTFLPLAVPAGSPGTAAAALLAFSCAMPLARWAAGRYGDRHGQAALLVPSVLATVVGMAGLVLLDVPYAVIVGAALFGAGFGAAQNATLALMFERSSPSQAGRVSALWNLAYDGGMGIGAVGFGLVAGPAGYSAGFALLGAVLALALVPSLLDKRSERKPLSARFGER
ncbi:MFS transporter [Microtetraspora sp. NBRC 13810]|uniref:MFS transporter n=1 Tax=Microtetraspora sp. NBRC 13810 TaxID=3030990 RepID=UPI0024A283EE|nr:MFS transporter [Microtetraspora sp. NBRC 13810]GLW05688.1 MFS transporter [Microtetraspora sp. NBRC 13810]